MSNIKSKDFGGRESDSVIVLQKRGWLCHFEGREGYGVSEWRVGNDFGFFTSMRYVQNDRVGMLDEVLAVDAVAG